MVLSKEAVKKKKKQKEEKKEKARLAAGRPGMAKVQPHTMTASLQTIKDGLALPGGSAVPPGRLEKPPKEVAVATAPVGPLAPGNTQSRLTLL